MQRNVDTIREVYSWLLGRLATAGWHDVLLLLPYAVVTAVVVLLHRAASSTCSSVGDEEAASLGLHPQRSRLHPGRARPRWAPPRPCRSPG